MAGEIIERPEDLICEGDHLVRFVDKRTALTLLDSLQLLQKKPGLRGAFVAAINAFAGSSRWPSELWAAYAALIRLSAAQFQPEEEGQEHLGLVVMTLCFAIVTEEDRRRTMDVFGCINRDQAAQAALLSLTHDFERQYVQEAEKRARGVASPGSGEEEWDGTQG